MEMKWPVISIQTSYKWISSAECNTRYLLCLNSARLKCVVSARLFAPARWFMTRLCTLGTRYPFSTAERHWMAAGSSSRASRKLITSVAPARAPRRAGVLLFCAHCSKNQNPLRQIYNEEQYSTKSLRIKGVKWGEISYSTVMKFH